MTNLTIVTGAPSPAASGVGSEQNLQNLVIDPVDVPQDDPNGPGKPPKGGATALPVPDEPNEQWTRALAAFETSAEDMSRAARHVQLIRQPLESLARDIATMTREIGGLRQEMTMLRENLTPPISTTTTGTTLMQHVGPVEVQANIVPPGLWVRIKSVAWHVAKGVVVALAVWGAMQLVGAWWPSLADVSAWVAGSR